ncbi:hypothetical protein IQ266_00270 [filamentous cyanobacterium LEGE 11480]|uniref:Uncharacterized protein n=1 Tax=Romeriopsis navalis LEGE 11480 TaxID=2777977 RepID=A0A928Z1N3_9CYAN|nr:hypothetical protein [Romeriopsis navalis]MBE9028187.1 hypothetical protein [Romeriopsis navalis LEGE 11480]
MLQFYPIARLHSWFTRWQRLLSILLISTIACYLTACGNGNFPNQKVIVSAVARQVEQIQQPLSQQLKLKPPSLKDIRISNLAITERDTTLINGAPAYYLSGQYDLTLKQQDQQTTQRGDHFEVYLQPKQDGKITRWQLAQKSGEAWELETLSTGKS